MTPEAARVLNDEKLKNYLGMNKHKACIEYMDKLEADQSIKRMIRVFYNGESIGLIFSNHRNQIRDGIKLFKCYKMHNDIIPIPDNFTFDDSLAWNFTHMIG